MGLKNEVVNLFLETLKKIKILKKIVKTTGFAKIETGLRVILRMRKVLSTSQYL